MIAETVAAPLEQEINGVEDMLYMSSQATSDGTMTLTVTFRLGTDVDNAQVQVQNRVAQALPRLPEDVRRVGVTTKKASPDLLMVVHLTSPDGRYDTVYLRNYATLQVRDVLARLPGMGEVRLFGAGDYSMRVWLDPERIASRGLTAGDVVRAIREQNVQVAAGVIGADPAPVGTEYQLNVTTSGRLITEEEFGDIIVKTMPDGERDDAARRRRASSSAPVSTRCAACSTTSPPSRSPIVAGAGRECAGAVGCRPRHHEGPEQELPRRASSTRSSTTRRSSCATRSRP